MRPLPLLLLVLGAVATIGLGWRVLGGTPPAVAPVAVEPATRGGIPQGHVYTGCVEEPDDVNPFTAHVGVARRILSYTHEGLLEVDPWTGELRPAVAERFEPDADGTACTFTLRSGLQFADGSAVTLDDVMFGWDLASCGPEHKGYLPMGFVGDAFARVRQVDRLDERRFRVHFRDAHYAALRVVGETWITAQKQFFVARVAARCHAEPVPAVDSAAFATLLGQIDLECGPGTGPYRLDNDAAGVQNWRPRQDLLLVANEHSWRRRAFPGTWNFAGLRFLFRDVRGTTNALLRGELDWFSSTSLGDLLAAHPELQRDYQRLLYDYDGLGVYRVVWNCRRGPTDDARVRRALGMLFDVEGLRQGSDGLGARALAHAKPGSGAYPTAVEPLPFDPVAARRLLRDAGYDPAAGRPLRLSVLALQGTDVLKRIADMFADAANKAGVELDLRRRDLGPWVQEKKAGDWHGLLVMQSFRAWGDPWDFLHSQGADNEGGWSNERADRAADAARAARDPAERDALWRELHTIAYAEQPAALLVHPLAAILLHRRIEGARPGRSGLVIERAFVAPANQRR